MRPENRANPARPAADPDDLPILGEMPRILAALESGPNLVIEAAPGAGKTTRVPLELLERGLADPGEILVLQPRRIAARLAAGYVAGLLGEPVGERCGYQVRFESKRSARTRISFITEAILTQRLRRDPRLEGVSAVFLDEFHERHIASDLNLALLRRLQREHPRSHAGSDIGRPDHAPRIIVMSATLDGEPIARFLDCPHIVCPGRSHPVELIWQGESSRTRAQRDATRRSFGGFAPTSVMTALRSLVDAGLDGHVLVFLPGAREIRETAKACASWVERAGLRCAPLYGELSSREQDEALRPSDAFKVILATNIAETSLTIDGVAAVIDSGLARVASHNPWSGLPRLDLARISQASAIQRAGRAGRTRAGRCIRLYDESDFAQRPEHDAPEISRLDLSAALLDLRAAGVGDPSEFDWFERPPEAALDAAETLLGRLGATDASGRELSPIGCAMLRYPVHPRQARLIVEGVARGIGPLAAGAAALLGERPIRRRGAPHPNREHGDADVLVDLDGLDAMRRNRGAAGVLGLDEAACRQVERARAQLVRLLPREASGEAPTAERDLDARERALRIALLCAYPDRVARMRRDAGGRRTLVLCGGGSARLGDESVVHDAGCLVALELAERRDPAARAQRNTVSNAAAIESDWLLDLFPDALEERTRLSWSPERERVEGRSEIVYDQLVIESSSLQNPGTEPEAEAILREAAIAAGPERFVREPAALPSLLARAAVVGEELGDVPRFGDDEVRACLSRLCEGKSSFRELEEADLLSHVSAGIQTALGTRGGAQLDRLAPLFVSIPGRRRVPVHYEINRPPWIESRLQDFFDLTKGPCIADGRVPLVLHLLAPNRRAVQVTTDLAGFWERHYPEIRRKLTRRYPRHAWPEDPLAGG